MNRTRPQYKKDKWGWVKFNPHWYQNELYPNVVLHRYNVPGILWPWEVYTGAWKGKEFHFDGKFEIKGLAAGDKSSCTQHAIRLQKKYITNKGAQHGQ